MFFSLSSAMVMVFSMDVVVGCGVGTANEIGWI